MPNAAAATGRSLAIRIPFGNAITTSSFGTERSYGACFLSRIRTKRYRAANEETCYEKALFPAFSVFVNAALKRFRDGAQILC